MEKFLETRATNEEVGLTCHNSMPKLPIKEIEILKEYDASLDDEEKMKEFVCNYNLPA